MNMWLTLLANAGLIILAGTQLSKNAERISRGLGLSTAWAGALLLSIATSLPELVTSRRAVIIGAPDLAGGNIFGSNLFNLALLVLIDLFYRRGIFTARRKRGLVLTAIFSIFLTGISIGAMVMKLPFRAGWVGLDTILILVVYLLGSGIIMDQEKEKVDDVKRADKKSFSRPPYETVRGMVFFLLAAAVIIFAGTRLTDTADLIAAETGLGKTLAGFLFIAAATSLPELVATVAAVRMGFPEMAIGNVFGSNFFNILIFFFTDFFYRQGLLMSVLSPQNIITAIMVIILTTVAIIGLLIPGRRRVVGLSVPSMIILAGYLATFIFLFQTG